MHFCFLMRHTSESVFLSFDFVGKYYVVCYKN